MDTPTPQPQDKAERLIQNSTASDNAAQLVNWNAETNQSYRDAQARTATTDLTITDKAQAQKPEVERTGYHRDNVGAVIAGTVLGTVASELLYGRPYPPYYPPVYTPPYYPAPYPNYPTYPTYPGDYYPQPPVYRPIPVPIPVPPIIINPGHGYPHGGYPHGGYPHGGYPHGGYPHGGRRR